MSMKLPTKNCVFLTFKTNQRICINPGQYILLLCENLSTLEWHPFTITDFVVELKRTTFTLAISNRGDWTGELHQKVSRILRYAQKSQRRKSRKKRKTFAPRKLIFKFDGPFPSPMESIVSRKRVVLIAAGIGITPFIAVFNFIMCETSSGLKKFSH
jgi:predicted ferric reductase